MLYPADFADKRRLKIHDNEYCFLRKSALSAG